MRELSAFLVDESGASSIEYAILAVGIAGAIIATVTLTGVEVQSKYTLVVNKLTGSGD